MEFFTNLLRKLRRSKTKPVKENKTMGLDVPITSYGTPGAYQQYLTNAMYGNAKRPVYTKRFEGDLIKRGPPDDIQ